MPQAQVESVQQADSLTDTQVAGSSSSKQTQFLNVGRALHGRILAKLALALALALSVFSSREPWRGKHMFHVLAPTATATNPLATP